MVANWLAGQTQICQRKMLELPIFLFGRFSIKLSFPSNGRSLRINIIYAVLWTPQGLGKQHAVLNRMHFPALKPIRCAHVRALENPRKTCLRGQQNRIWPAKALGCSKFGSTDAPEQPRAPQNRLGKVPGGSGNALGWSPERPWAVPEPPGSIPEQSTGIPGRLPDHSKMVPEELGPSQGHSGALRMPPQGAPRPPKRRFSTCFLLILLILPARQGQHSVSAD